MKTSVIVAIKNGFDINKIASALAENGFSVKDVLGGVGAITGELEERNMSSFESIEGVAKITRSRLKDTPWSPRN